MPSRNSLINMLKTVGIWYLLLFSRVAAESNENELAKSLIEDSETALHLAILNKNYEMAKLLIKEGADPTIKIARSNTTDTQLTYIHLLSSGDQDTDALDLLEKAGVDLLAKTTPSGSTALHYAVTGKPKIPYIKRLLELEPSLINRQNYNKNTVLIIAAFQGNRELAKLFIENKADVNLQNHEEATALHIAVDNGKTKLAKLLIENGADVNLQNNDGNTALHLAVYKGNTKLAEFLIENGADVDLKNNDGNTALHLAVYKGNTKLAEFLTTYKKPGNFLSVFLSRCLEVVYGLALAYLLYLCKRSGKNTENNLLIKERKSKKIKAKPEKKVKVEVKVKKKQNSSKKSVTDEIKNLKTTKKSLLAQLRQGKTNLENRITVVKSNLTDINTIYNQLNKKSEDIDIIDKLKNIENELTQAENHNTSIDLTAFTDSDDVKSLNDQINNLQKQLEIIRLADNILDTCGIDLKTTENACTQLSAAIKKAQNTEIEPIDNTSSTTQKTKITREEKIKERKEGKQEQTKKHKAEWGHKKQEYKEQKLKELAEKEQEEKSRAATSSRSASKSTFFPKATTNENTSNINNNNNNSDGNDEFGGLNCRWEK